MREKTRGRGRKFSVVQKEVWRRADAGKKPGVVFARRTEFPLNDKSKRSESRTRAKSVIICFPTSEVLLEKSSHLESWAIADSMATIAFRYSERSDGHKRKMSYA